MGKKKVLVSYGVDIDVRHPVRSEHERGH
jgi:hypothetical protein